VKERSQPSQPTYVTERVKETQVQGIKNSEIWFQLVSSEQKKEHRRRSEAMKLIGD